LDTKLFPDLLGVLEAVRWGENKSACRGEGSAVGLELRVRVVPAPLLAVLRTALFLKPKTAQVM
jgi:hypothetical protein